LKWLNQNSVMRASSGFSSAGWLKARKCQAIAFCTCKRLNSSGPASLEKSKAAGAATGCGAAAGSAIAGALFMLACDTAARSLTASEIPVGIITAIAGAPFLAYLIRQRTAGLFG